MPPGCAVDSGSLLIRFGIAEMERCKAGGTIGQPVFGFTEYAVLQDVALVLGAEIIAERRSVFPAIFKGRPDTSDDAKDENKSTNEYLRDR